jgi:hypothetical protein
MDGVCPLIATFAFLMEQQTASDAQDDRNCE